MSRIAAPLACCTLLLGLSACSGNDYDDDRPPGSDVPSGVLELRWSIDGRTDPTVCDEVGAVAFRVDIFDQNFFIGDIDVPCADFSATQELFADDYLVRSTLVDTEGFAVLLRVVEDFVEIAEARVTRLEMDFPLPPVPMEPNTEPEPDAGAPTDAGLPQAPDAAPADAGT